MTLHYKLIGTGNPIIILHGLFGMGDNLFTFGKMLEALHNTVYLVDLRNHGRSPHSSEHNYKVMSEDVVQLIKGEHLHQPIVFGHSMGGKVAMQLAIDYPYLVAKIIIVDITPFYYAPHHYKIIDALKSIDLHGLNTRKEAEQQLMNALNDAGTVQFLLKSLYRKEDNLFAWRFNLDALASNRNETGRETTVNAPCLTPALFIKGERSDYIREASFNDIKKVFPHAVLKVVAGAGHWVHADNPQGLTEAVADFLL